MKKQYLIGIGVLVLIIVIVGFTYRYNIVEKFLNKKFMNYPFLKVKSNVRIDCDTVDDCKKVINRGNCKKQSAINIIISNESWKNYCDEANKIIKSKVRTDCPLKLNYNDNIIKDLICSEENICGLKNKKIEFEKKYIKIGNITTKVRNDCKYDDDCQIIQQKFGCFGPTSIRKDNLQVDIDGYYSAGQKHFEKLKEVLSCAPPPPMDELIPICKDYNTCGMKHISE